MNKSSQENFLISEIIPDVKTSIDTANLPKLKIYLKNCLRVKLDTEKLPYMKDMEIPLYALSYAAKKACEAKLAGQFGLANDIWKLFEFLLECEIKSPFIAKDIEEKEIYAKSLGFAMATAAKAYSNYQFAVLKLMNLGASPDIIIDDRGCLLLRSVNPNQLVITTCILQKALDSKAPVNSDVLASFFKAIEFGKNELIDIYLKFYPDILLMLNISKDLPLTYAAKNKQWDIFENLLNRMEFAQKRTAIFHSLSEEIRNNLGEALCHTALYYTNMYLKSSERLLDLGANPNVFYNNCVLIFVVIEKGCIGMLDLLLQYGTNVHVLDLKGGNPLHAAAVTTYKTTKRMIQSLLEAGADSMQKSSCHCDVICNHSDNCKTAKLPINMTSDAANQNLFIDFARKPCGKFVIDAHILVLNIYSMKNLGKHPYLCPEDGSGNEAGYTFDIALIAEILKYTNWAFKHACASFDPIKFKEEYSVEKYGFFKLPRNFSPKILDKNPLDSILCNIDTLEPAFLYARQNYLKFDLFGKKEVDYHQRLEKVIAVEKEHGPLLALRSFLIAPGNADSTSLKQLVINNLLGPLAEIYSIKDVVNAIPAPALPERKKISTSMPAIL